MMKPLRNVTIGEVIETCKSHWYCATCPLVDACLLAENHGDGLNTLVAYEGILDGEVEI